MRVADRCLQNHGRVPTMRWRDSALRACGSRPFVREPRGYSTITHPEGDAHGTVQDVNETGDLSSMKFAEGGRHSPRLSEL